jgi:uncharacterized protein
MQRFIKEHEDPARALLGPGSYLAGFSFEKSGRPDEALRYYDEALAYGRYLSLIEPVRRLARVSSYRTPRLRELLGAEPRPALPEAETETETETEDGEGRVLHQEVPAAPPEEGEILAIIGFGRVPAKFAKRVPIGLALTYASSAMSPHDHQRASYLAAQGLVTWVNYPELGQPRGEYDLPLFALGPEWRALDGVLAVDREARRAWEQARGAVIAAAITRMIARVVAGEAVRRGSGGGVVGALLSLGTQATLTAADTPDTRSWSTLPARLAFGRARVPPGKHWVTLEARGVRKRQQVSVAPGGWAVVSLVVLN